MKDSKVKTIVKDTTSISSKANTMPQKDYAENVSSSERAIDNSIINKSELDELKVLLNDTEIENNTLRSELVLSNNSNLELVKENTRLNNVVKCLENRVANLHRFSISKADYAEISRRLTDTLDLNKGMFKALTKYNTHFWRRLSIKKLKF